MVIQSPTDIGEILRKGNFVALPEAFKNWSPSALVRIIADLSTEDQMIVFRIMPEDSRGKPLNG